LDERRNAMGKEKMTSAIWMGKGEVKIEEWPIPQPGDDEVLIDVSHTGICASDMHIIGDGLPLTVASPPRIIGHEFSGEVEAFGSKVKGYKKGDKVVAHPVGPCGECFHCREGEENLCLNPFSVIRNPQQGSFAEYIVVKAKQVYPLPEKVPLREAALVEPVAIAIHAVDRAEIKTGQTVLVIGGGTIGLLTMQVAKLSGASRVILSEPVLFKRKVAEQVGADRTVDPLTEDLSAVIRDLTAGRGVDICIEAVGSPKAIEQGFGLIRDKGRLVVVGWPPATSTITISPFQIYRRELDIRGSFFSPYSFQRAIQILPRLNLEPVISHCFDLEKISEAIGIMKQQKGIKVLLKP
jgi:2-desacetyl-2-hydroxyethyl bacteriochlorophyllide A dehydrogenase